MKLSVKQMYDWNCYAYCAEEVEEKDWEYFQNELWWQLGNSFIKTFDNVEGFPYCAENFKKYGEISIGQALKRLPVPWEKALSRLLPLLDEIGAPWYLHGSAAMALWGIPVEPGNINVIFPNAPDFDRVRKHLEKLAIKPFQRCDNWVMSGLGEIFLEANIGFSFHNPQEEPFDMETLAKVAYDGRTVFLSTLEMLRADNLGFGRPERVRLIEERMKQAEI